MTWEDFQRDLLDNYRVIESGAQHLVLLIEPLEQRLRIELVTAFAEPWLLP